MTADTTGPARTIAELLARQARTHADQPALLAPGRPVLTYRDLAERVGTTASALRGLDISRADRVALAVSDRADLAIALLAVMSTAAAVPLDPGCQPAEFGRYLTGSRTRAVLADAAGAAAESAAALGVPTLGVAGGGPESWPSGVDLVSGRLPATGTAAGPPVLPTDHALVFHTSGTTGPQKVVPLRQAAVCLSAADIAADLELTPADRCLNVVPLFHAHGVLTPLLASLSAGASLVCLPRFEADGFFGLLARYRPTWYSAVPTIHHAVLREAAGHRHEPPAPGLRFVRSASAPLPERALRDLERTFRAPVIEAYGMTETTSVIASNPMPPRVRKPGSVGLPVSCEIRVVGADGQPLGAGQVGEVVVRSGKVTAGYDDADTSAFVDGWFRTGDLGRFDEDGYLFLAGRTKETINRGGVTVSPFEIDRVLQGHPSVAQAIAFPVPHPTLGEDVAVAIVPRPGTSLTEREVRDYAARHLGRTSVPSRVVVVDTLPKGPTGKVQRLRLHEQLPQPKETFATPRTELEQTVAGVWCQVLGRDRVGLHDNLFDLGGDSLQATRIAAAVTGATGTAVSPVDVFVCPTVSLLAEFIAAGPSPGERDDHGEETAVRHGRARLAGRAARGRTTSPRSRDD